MLIINDSCNSSTFFKKFLFSVSLLLFLTLGGTVFDLFNEAKAGVYHDTSLNELSSGTDWSSWYQSQTGQTPEQILEDMFLTKLEVFFISV